jgi:hypothetical protein
MSGTILPREGNTLFTLVHEYGPLYYVPTTEHGVPTAQGRLHALLRVNTQ